MKYWKQIAAFTLLSLFAQGQSITYKVIKDTPDDFANYWVNLGILDVGFGKDNEGFGLLGANLNTVVHYKNKFGGEFTFRRYLFDLSDDGYEGKQFEIGGFYNLFSKKKSKSHKIMLSASSQSKISMNVPATIQRAFGVRAGFNYMNEGLTADSLIHEISGNYISKSSGLYAGILMTSSINIKTHSTEYGIKGSGFVRRNYLDVIFNPINPVFNMDGTKLTTQPKVGALGFRLGIEFLQAEPKKVSGKALYQKFEIGSRPIDGYYATYTLGISFKRKVKSMSSFVVVREKE